MQLRISEPMQYYKKVYARMAKELPEGKYVSTRRKFDPFSARGSNIIDTSETESGEDDFEKTKKSNFHNEFSDSDHESK